MNKLEIFQLKIILVDSDPEIWRRFLVRSDTHFGRLHYIIQDVMGWENEHLYEFVIGEERLSHNPFEDFIGSFRSSGQASSLDVLLSDRLKRVGKKFLYIYDFGDNWEHEIVFEKRTPFAGDQLIPACIEGERACPPENSGGIWGFYYKLDLLETLGTPDEDPDAYEVKEWMGDYDASHFCVDEVNQLFSESLVEQREIEQDEIEQDEDIPDDSIMQSLDEVSEPQTVGEFLYIHDIEDNEITRAEIAAALAVRGDMVWDKERDKLYPDHYILKNFKVRIRPTAWEIEKGILFPGHRLIPFSDFTDEIDEMDVVYHYRSLEKKEMTFKWREVEPFLVLLSPGDDPRFISGVKPDPDQEYVYKVWDLRELYQKSRFKPGDTLVFKQERSDQWMFSVKPVSAAKMEKQRQKIEQADRALLEGIGEIWNMSIPFSSVSHQLLYLIYRKEPRTWEAPGSPYEVLFNEREDIAYSTLEDGRTILHPPGADIKQLEQMLKQIIAPTGAGEAI
jgi:hypothetical protein